jgi:repressor LexA
VMTARQEMVLGLIRESIVTRGSAPSVRELAEALGVRSTNGIVDHLKALQRKGFIERTNHQARGIRLIERLHEAS